MEEIIIPIAGIIGVFGMPAFIVWAALSYNHKKRAQFHASLQALIEKEQNLTPELLKSIPGFVDEEEKINDIKTGSILIAVGIGVALIGSVGLDKPIVMTAGLLVCLLGIAFLGYGIYDKRQGQHETD